MSWEELVAGVRALDTAGRQRLMLLLQTIEDFSNQAYRQELARKIDDKNPENWISWEDAKARLLPEE